MDIEDKLFAAFVAVLIAALVGLVVVMFWCIARDQGAKFSCRDRGGYVKDEGNSWRCSMSMPEKTP
jgi:hypothetical protein